MHTESNADVVIVGGGTGGCAAALACARMGLRVVMTEPTRWIGGQLTSQSVPPDEHPWIEQFGCTRSYRRFRDGVRAYYRNHFPLSEKAANTPYLNPGNGSVSRLCHEPRAALAVLEAMLAPYVHSGRLRILTEHTVVGAAADGDRLRAVTVRQTRTGALLTLAAPYVLDATECGDVLPLAGAEYVTGSESQKETGEPHALAGEADPLDMQAISHCFALDYREGENWTIDKPADYEFWRNYKADFWPDKQLSWVISHHVTHEPNDLLANSKNDALPPLWTFRRMIDKTNFAPGTYDSDLSLINWVQMDYWLGPVFEVPEEQAAEHLRQAKQLSLSFLYWMQTEAPRADGKIGFPGLRLRGDVTEGPDGLAMAPYIRESRRIRAEFTVLEQHVAADVRGAHGAETFADSVGIGSYRIDLHPSTGNRNYIDISCHPFQIPLGSLIPVRMDNLLPACKNIGVTHITNGCYRLHPVEWNIGEAAGLLSAYCLKRGIKPRQVLRDRETLSDFQSLLVKQGIELNWPHIRPL